MSEKLLSRAHARGLSRREWYEVFLKVAKIRTGLDENDFSKEDVLSRYYSPDTTPFEAVSKNMQSYGLVELITSPWR